MFPYCPHGPWGYGGMMFLAFILFWIVLIGGGILLIRTLMQRGAVAGPAPETPRAVLDRRLAAGEITAEEYDSLRGKIEGS